MRQWTSYRFPVWTTVKVALKRRTPSRRRARRRGGFRNRIRARGDQAVRRGLALCRAGDQRTESRPLNASQMFPEAYGAEGAKGMRAALSCAGLGAACAESASLGRRNKMPRVSQRYAFKMKSW